MKFKMKFRNFLVFSIILLFTQHALSQRNLNTNNINSLSPGEYPIYIQKKGDITPAEFIENSQKFVFNKNIDSLPSKGNISFWLRMDAINIPNHGIILELYLPNNATAKLYTYNGLNYNIEEELILHKKIRIKPDYYFFKIKNTTREIFIHFSAKQFTGFKIKKYTKYEYFKRNRWLSIYYGFALGIFLLLILYHTVLYFKVHDKSYLYYALYTFFSSTLVFQNSAYFTLDLSALHDISLMSFQLASMFFAASYLNLYIISKSWKKVIITTAFFILIINSLHLLAPSSATNLLTNILSLIIYLGIIYATVTHSQIKSKLDKLFLIPWAVLLLIHLAYMLKLVIVFEYFQTLEIGLLINICLLALAFGNKLNIYKDEKKEAELMEIKALQERDKLMHEQNSILELLINERHKELLKKNKKLIEQQNEIEEQNNQIKITNNQLEVINQELFNKNIEIAQQNKELQKHHELLEKIVNKRTKKLVAAKERAIVADQLKTSFLNNLTFEIHTPMNAIMGFASLLTDKNISKEKRNEYLSIINKNVDILLEAIDNIVILARIQARVIKTKMSDFKLEELFAKCRDFFEDKLKSTGNKAVVLDIYNLDTKADITVSADYDKIWQILYKLIDNSVKYTPKGEIKVEYTIQNVTPKINEPVLTIKVKDNGVGIDLKKREFLFERFSIIEDDKTKLYHGAGIGLAIVKGLIDILEGNIKVDSEVNVGTTFEISIPIIVKN